MDFWNRGDSLREGKNCFQIAGKKLFSANSQQNFPHLIRQLQRVPATLFKHATNFAIVSNFSSLQVLGRATHPAYGPRASGFGTFEMVLRLDWNTVTTEAFQPLYSVFSPNRAIKWGLCSQVSVVGVYACLCASGERRRAPRTTWNSAVGSEPFELRGRSLFFDALYKCVVLL